MDARRIIAAAIIALATAGCGSATFVEDDERAVPLAPPTDTAGAIPPPMGM